MKKSFLLVLSLIVSFATIGCNSNGESIDTTTPLSSSASDNSETAESSNSTIAPPTFYTIIYNGNGNTSGFIPNQIVDFGTYFIIEQNAFLKDGYIFSKWNTKSDGTGITYRPGERLLDITTPFDDSITLYAIWEGKDYTVTLNNVSNSLDNIVEISFDSNGGVGNFPNQLIGNGNRFVQFPGVPTRELYAFTGWYYDVDCARLFDFESDLVYQNSTLYAGWEKMIGIGSWHDDKTRYNCYVDTTIYNRENKYLLDMFSTSIKDPIYLYFTAYMSQTIDIHYCSSEANKTILFSVIDFSTNTYLFTEVKVTSISDTITFNMEIGHVYRICAYIEYMTAKGPFLELYFSNCSYPVFNNNFIEHVIAGSPYNLYVPKLKGLSFVGWVDSFGNILTDENGCSLDVWDIYQDASLYGKWVANENTISYILNGGVNSIDNPDAFTVLDSIVF